MGKRLNNSCGAGWRVRTIFLGAVRSPWGLSLSRLVGFGIWLPPTHVGARDNRPTAVSAPAVLSSAAPFGLARARDPGPHRFEGVPAPRRALPARAYRPGRSPSFQSPPRR